MPIHLFKVDILVICYSHLVVLRASKPHFLIQHKLISGELLHVAAAGGGAVIHGAMKELFRTNISIDTSSSTECPWRNWSCSWFLVGTGFGSIPYRSIGWFGSDRCMDEKRKCWWRASRWVAFLLSCCLTFTNHKWFQIITNFLQLFSQDIKLIKSQAQWIWFCKANQLWTNWMNYIIIQPIHKIRPKLYNQSKYFINSLFNFPHKK